MKQKKNIILFAITMILSLIIFYFFVTGYYSIDTIRIWSQGWTEYATQDAYIRDGRLISALIFVIIGLLNPDILTVYIINVIVAIIILSVCVVQIYNIIGRYKLPKNKKYKIIAFMLSYTYIFNFITVDVLRFVDSFVISSSILLFIMAIKKIIIEKKNKIGFVLTILGVLCYQGTIPMYIATAVLITLLENKKINKEYFKKILPCAIYIIISSIISVIIVNLVPIITNMEMTNRLKDIGCLENIKVNLLYMSEYIFKTFYLFPPYMWTIFNIIILAITIIYGIKNKNIELPFYVLVIFICYILAIFIMMPIQILVSAVRVAMTLGQTISAMLIIIYCKNFDDKKTNAYEKIIICILVIYFIITIVSIVKSTYELKLANKIDEEFSQKIENEIINLEEQGITINKIGINYTGSGNNLQKYSSLVREESRYIEGLYVIKLHEFYTGRKISSELLLTKEQIESYFDTSSAEEVQFKNVDDVIYILVDL